MTTTTGSPLLERPLRADAQRNRERIMEVAETAFRDLGGSIQMDEIARAAGVGVGTLYRHFPTKEALIAELVAARHVATIEDAEHALAEQNAWAALECFVFRSAEQMATHVGLRDAIAGAHGIDTQSFVKWKHCAMARAQLRERMDALIDRAQADGSLRSDVTTADLSALLSGLSAAISQGADWRRLTSIVMAGLRADTVPAPVA